MDLFALLKKEVEDLYLTEELAIARYLYLRTGELFDYNPAFYTYNSEKKINKIFRQHMDIHHVQNFYLICTSWARLYVDLLEAFHISAQYVEKSHHAYVKFKVNHQTIVADLMNYFVDISKIKMGFTTSYFYYDTFFTRFLEKKNPEFLKKVSSKKFAAVDKQLHYFKGIYADDVLEMIKNEIYNDHYSSVPELMDRVMNAIQLIINIERPYIGFISGTTIITEILEYLLGGSQYYIHYTDLYDKERKEFIGVYVNTYNNENKCYVYQKDKSGYYKLEEQSFVKVKKLAKHYKGSDKNIFKLERRLVASKSGVSQ